MYILKQTIKNKEKTFEYIKFNNKYEFNQIKYYISYINRYKIFKILFNDVIEDYDIFIESMSKDINNPRKIGNLFLSYINSVKKFEEKSHREFRKLFDDNFFKNILKEAHNNKAYNLIYNMRNYDEHIGSPIKTIQVNINGDIKLLSDIDEIKKELKETGWKKLLDKQFESENRIEVNLYIKESYDIVNYIYKKIYEYIILEDIFLSKFCVRIQEFYNSYKSSNDVFALYLCDEKKYTKLELANNIDILFAKEILFAKVLHVTNIEFETGDVIIDNEIKYRCVLKNKDILNNKIVDQVFVPACLDNKDIKFILDNIKNKKK